MWSPNWLLGSAFAVFPESRSVAQNKSQQLAQFRVSRKTNMTEQKTGAEIQTEVLL